MPAFLLPILARYGLHIAAVVGCVVAYFAWARHIEHKGVIKERVRVETKGKEIDAKARDARRAAERAPHDSLRKYLRD